MQVRNLFDQAHVPFSKTDHHHTDEVRGSLVKGAPEDLSLAMSNFREVTPLLPLPLILTLIP